MIRAILFDLDGTLLMHDIDQFLPRYLALINRRMAAQFPGVDVAALIMASTPAMMRNDGSRTNEAAFWSDFAPRIGQAREAVESMFLEFYQRDFPTLGADIVTEPEAAEVIAACRAHGLRLVVATNPLFPRIAIDERLRWAGLVPAQFDLITSYEWMRYCKPHPGYFRQIAGELGLDPGTCLMVGNDIALDLQPAAAAQMHTCLLSNAYQVPAADGFRPEHTCALGDVPALVRSLNGQAQ